MITIYKTTNLINGKPSPNKGKPMSDEAKHKLSVTNTGKKRGKYKPRLKRKIKELQDGLSN